MKKNIFIVFGAVFIVFAGVWLFWERQSGEPLSGNGGEEQVEWLNPRVDLIRVFAPTPNAKVKSPLHIEGEARGTWYFEASFPVKVLDANGKQLGIMPAQAEGEWMTENFVPFRADLMFETPTTETGVLVLEKDNPSGLPEYADEIRMPIRFEELFQP